MGSVYLIMRCVRLGNHLTHCVLHGCIQFSTAFLLVVKRITLTVDAFKATLIHSMTYHMILDHSLFRVLFLLSDG